MRLAWMMVLLMACTDGPDTDAPETGDSDTDVDTSDDRPDCDAPIALTLTGIEDPGADTPFRIEGVELTVKARDGALTHDVQTFGALWLYPGRLVLDTSDLDCRVGAIALDDNSTFCGDACATLTTYDADGNELESQTFGGNDTEVGVEGEAFATAELSTGDSILSGITLR